MTMITFQKPLTHVSWPQAKAFVLLHAFFASRSKHIVFEMFPKQEAIEQLMSQTVEGKCLVGDEKQEAAAQADNVGQTKRYWWSWRRSQDAAPNHGSNAHGMPLGKDEKGTSNGIS